MLCPPQGISISEGIQCSFVSLWWHRFWSPSQDAVWFLHSLWVMFSSVTSKQLRREFKSMQIYFSWLNFPLRFSIHWRFLSDSVSTMMVANWWRRNFTLLSTFTSYFSQHPTAASALPSPIFIYLFDIGMDSPFPIFFNALYSLLYLLFWCSNCPRSGKWKPLQAGACVLVTRTLLSGIRCCGLILQPPCLSSATSHFSEVSFSGYVVRDQDLGARYAHCYCSVFFF